MLRIDTRIPDFVLSNPGMFFKQEFPEVVSSLSVLKEPRVWDCYGSQSDQVVIVVGVGGFTRTSCR